MAAISLRRVIGLVRTTATRQLSVTPIRLSEMANPMDHATGIEKREMLAIQGGDKDPFMLNTIIKRGAGTKESPTLIPSAFDGRMVGCSCCDNRFVNWMWLEKGCPKRCECGHWFKLKEIKPL